MPGHLVGAHVEIAIGETDVPGVDGELAFAPGGPQRVAAFLEQAVEPVAGPGAVREPVARADEDRYLAADGRVAQHRLPERSA